jgi:SsrA-binding protein
MVTAKGDSGTKLITQNRKARYEYSIEETYEAGLVLTGTEVKACREGRANLTDAYAVIDKEEAYLLQCHISPYSHGNRVNHEPLRPRKLLLHRSEVDKLKVKSSQEGRTLVPLRLYFKNGYAKAEIAVARGKKSHDKRADIATREAQRRMRQLEGRRR